MRKLILNYCKKEETKGKKGQRYYIQVQAQSHTHHEFLEKKDPGSGDDYRLYMPLNKFVSFLGSDESSPDVGGEHFWVHGSKHKDDDEVMLVTESAFEDITALVMQYNKMHNKNSGMEFEDCFYEKEGMTE